MSSEYRTCGYHVVVLVAELIHRVESLFADAGQVDVVPVPQHLGRYLGGVDDGSGCRAQVVQRCLALQQLAKASRH